LSNQNYTYSNGHSYLKILDANKNVVLKVKTSSKSHIIQVRESADILSRGKPFCMLQNPKTSYIHYVFLAMNEYIEKKIRYMTRTTVHVILKIFLL
jgi:hypothetical protein